MTGGERALLFILSELLPYFDIKVVVPGFGMLQDKVEKLGVPVIQMGIPNVLDLYTATDQIDERIHVVYEDKAWPALIELLLAEEPDFVYVNTTVHPIPALAAKMMGIRVIWSLLEVLHGPNIAHAADVIDTYSDHILTCSQAILDPLRIRASIVSKAQVLYPSWRPEEFGIERWPSYRETFRQKLKLADDQVLVMLIAASMSNNKGMNDFFRMAVNIAPKVPNAHFCVVGTQTTKAEHRQLLDGIQSHHLEDRFHIMPFEKEVQMIYPAADIVVVPSIKQEGLPLVAQEAMLFGKPVVLYSTGGQEEIGRITHNDDNIVPIRDVVALASRVATIALNPRYMQEVGLYLQGQAQHVFSLENYRHHLHNIVHQWMPTGTMKKRLVQGTSATIYVIEGRAKHPIESPLAFSQHGYDGEEIRHVPDEFLNFLPNGEPLMEHRSATPAPPPPAADQVQPNNSTPGIPPAAYYPYQYQQLYPYFNIPGLLSALQNVSAEPSKKRKGRKRKGKKRKNRVRNKHVSIKSSHKKKKRR
jgi:glycosyltransferase involved in cell wall biosynthesis